MNISEIYGLHITGLFAKIFYLSEVFSDTDRVGVVGAHTSFG